MWPVISGHVQEGTVKMEYEASALVKRILSMAFSAVIVAMMSYYGLRFADVGQGVSQLYPAIAFIIAFGIWFGAWGVAGVYMGAILGGMMAGYSFEHSAILMIADALEAAIPAIFYRLLNSSPIIYNTRSFLDFLFVSLILTNFLGATAGILLIGLPAFGSSWMAWFSGNILVTVFLLPVLAVSFSEVLKENGYIVGRYGI